ncbi:MAG: hypothetical protein JOZ78_23310 [Chroococcidiopsidaceae cyanobacterium CP_BM_ER_R8_30]|nr:hypothetical protein [Chroococcidiopsidaceae cyanobacterium CP_BM_ER_R8_30]
MLKKTLYFLTTTALLSSLFSCSNISDNKPGAANVASNDKMTPQTAEKTSSQVIPKKVIPNHQADLAKMVKLTNEARFLAGMKVGEKSSLATQEKSQVWESYAAFFNDSWDRLEKQQLAPIRKWSTQQLKPVYQTSKFIFYPFSGPDFLYCYSFFPQGNTYVLAGLEPVGYLPTLEKTSTAEIANNLQKIEQSLGAILRWSFFRTNDMKQDLSEQGVLPILFVFLARTNNKIQNVQYIGLDKDARIQILDKDNKEKLLPGVKIEFVPSGSSEIRSLYYFSVDLSNSALKKAPEFDRFIQKFGKPISYLKAASYLLHYEGFSNIRNLILSQSTSVLQDDSGIPVKYFSDSKWILKFYGNYTRPIALFSNEYQPELRNIYQSKANVKPLYFGIGYQYRVNNSNLMLAIKKK